LWAVAILARRSVAKATALWTVAIRAIRPVVKAAAKTTTAEVTAWGAVAECWWCVE
jgi:hypothetical protein